jgi:Family of unknown function (DUF6090)
MIKFFRKIRQQLLSENRFTKYLIYAAGEILLVVIGILIALQINNWNENRKSKNKEIYYLQSLKDEFLENKARTEHGIKFHQTQIKNAHLVLSILDKDSTYNNLEEVHFAILQTGWAWAGDFKSDVWTELLSTGSVELISNDILRKSITDFHSRAAFMVRLEHEWSTYNLHYRSISGDILPSKLRLEVGASLGHYDKERDIAFPLLSQKKLEENINKVNGLSPAITDVIIVRKAGLSLLENINKIIDDVLEKLEMEYKLKTKG